MHIVRFCAQESVAHAQKEHKVSPLIKCLKLVCTLLNLKLNQTNKNWCVQCEANQETYMIANL